MAKGTPETVSSKPLFDWFKADKKNRGVLRAAGYTDGRITNWKNRGIPRGELGAVAAHMGITYEAYLTAAGIPAPDGAPPRLPIEEAEALKRLNKALPDWRRYVLGLAMIDNHQTQEVLLNTMREAVPDRRVEEFISVAPHVAARRKEKTR